LLNLTDIDYTPKTLETKAELTEKCSGTCYLLLSDDEALVKALSAVNQLYKTKKAGMRIYKTTLFADLKSDFDKAVIIALNGGKGWYKKYDGDLVERDMAEWMDGVKLGDGKKIPLGEKVKEMFGIKAKAAPGTPTPTESAQTINVEDIMAGSTTVEGLKIIFGDEGVHDEL
jgi:hypothetical protein